eukprot:6211717-Pleurochrysis_carterae.AAC.1
MVSPRDLWSKAAGRFRTPIRAREVARSSGMAVTRVSDPHIGVEDHHTPPRASGRPGMECRPCPSRLVRTL